MSSKREKRQRKNILRELRWQQQSEAEAKMPLTKTELKVLFDWIDKRYLFSTTGYLAAGYWHVVGRIRTE